MSGTGMRAVSLCPRDVWGWSGIFLGIMRADFWPLAGALWVYYLKSIAMLAMLLYSQASRLQRESAARILPQKTCV